MAGEIGNFAQTVSRIQRDLDRLGVRQVDMRRAPALELQYAGGVDLGIAPSGRGNVGFEPLEGPIEARKVPPRDGETGIRAFLDGAQRTLPAFRVGLAPVVVTIAAAAILERDERGECRVRPGTLRMSRAWLVPHLPGSAEVAAVIDHLRASGATVVDTLTVRGPAHSESDEPAGSGGTDYGRLTELAFIAARQVRDDLEQRLLGEWEAGLAGDPDEWIVVDGRLKREAPRAIGLVKQFTETHLDGAQAEMLLDLPEGYRTTAFHPTDRRRGGDQPEARSLWYLRLWNSEGFDARHALVRLETHQSVTRTEEIDRISSWVLYERTPRATGDERWAVLLYPIHLLERALKQRVEADVRGWPT